MLGLSPSPGPWAVGDGVAWMAWPQGCRRAMQGPAERGRREAGPRQAVHTHASGFAGSPDGSRFLHFASRSL